jgi:glycosyltransferase involved in cell wall biosynthesis
VTTSRISVVTVTKDNAGGLRRTLESIRRQSVQPCEVLIIDAMSKDESQTVAQSVMAPTWSYLREPDRGPYDGMNKGWRRARGEYIHFLNAGDTLIDSNGLAKIGAALDGAPNAAWLVCGARRPLGGREVTIPGLPHRWWRHALGLQPQCHQACIFSRALLEVLDGIAENFSFVGDFDLVLRAGMVTPPTELPEVLVRYEGGGISEDRAKEIPALLHKVRVARLGLSGWLIQADRLWARSLRIRSSIGRRRRRRAEHRVPTNREPDESSGS